MENGINEFGARENWLVVLSGNIGVGKSTLGPYLAECLKGVWLSECTVSSWFSHLFTNKSSEARLISQMAFATMISSRILSGFAAGERLLVSERSLYDCILFHQLWRRRFHWDSYDGFFAEFYSILQSRPIEFNTITVWLTCELDVIAQRVGQRKGVVDTVHDWELLGELEAIHDQFFQENPPRHLLRFDTTTLENKEADLAEFSSAIGARILEITESSVPRDG